MSICGRFKKIPTQSKSTNLIFNFSKFLKQCPWKCQRSDVTIQKTKFCDYFILKSAYLCTLTSRNCLKPFIQITASQKKKVLAFLHVILIILLLTSPWASEVTARQETFYSYNPVQIPRLISQSSVKHRFLTCAWQKISFEGNKFLWGQVAVIQRHPDKALCWDNTLTESRK